MKAVLIRSPKGLVGSTPADQARHLRELLTYEPETGIFRWSEDRLSWNGRRRHVVAGEAAGTTSKWGYRRINIGNKIYMAHRLAWLWVHGAWPVGDIDHINGSRGDNRIANLRDVSRTINLQNIRACKAAKKTGTLLGTSWHAKSRKWRALIKVDGRQKSLGYYQTEGEAHAAYVAAKRQLHEGNTL